MSKILYVTPGCFDKGGISRYCRYQITCLRELYGAQNIKVISLLGPDENDIEEPFQVYWHGRKNSLPAKISFTAIILKTIIFWRPALIHVAHIHFSGVITFFAKIFRMKTVLNVYGIEVWSGLSIGASFGLRQVDFIISDCHHTAEYIQNHKRTKGEMNVIWDCVDLNKFRNYEEHSERLQKKYSLPDRDKHFIVLTLGRMSKDAAYKGYSRLIEVVSMVLERGRDVCLVMAGSGDYIEELRDRALTLGIEKNVTFTGSVDEKDIAGLYSYGHLFSLVTEVGIAKGEGIPLTPLEAMACRVPIVVGNQDGSREAVFENQNGYVIDPWDLKRHAEIICTMVDQPELRIQMAINAERIAGHYFGYELFKEKHEQMFKRVFN